MSLPLHFEGRRINKRTVHLARFSAEWHMFRRGMQRGPDPVPQKKATLNAHLDAPPVGKVVHVDFYLSTVRPYWENRENVLRSHDAGMGPLRNAAGQFLTAAVSHAHAQTEPDPFGDPSQGVPAEDCIRGVGEAVDKTGLLWICEKMIPKSKLQPTSPPRRKPSDG